MLTVRFDGSHSVALAELLVPSGHVLNWRRQYGSRLDGMGPRDVPSHWWQPMVQPFENQKQASAERERREPIRHTH